MKNKIWMMLLLGSTLLVQACSGNPNTDPDKDAEHKRANREEYAEQIQSSNGGGNK